jgi:hypothetical protein
MSAQCWCFHCAGRIVTRNTFVNHGRKQKPDPPRENPVVPLVSMPMPLVPQDVYEQGPFVPEHSSSEDSDQDIEGAFDLGPRGDEETTTGRGELTAREVTLLLLDWMATHKITDAASSDLWTLVTMLLPEGCDPITFNQVKLALKGAELKYVQRIELCPNDHVAFWNSKYLPTPYRHAHRTRCPVCGADRVLTDPSDGSKRPAKVVYFFPVKPYLRSLWSRPDLAPYLLADRPDANEGDVKNSRGWKHKMVDNPVMNQDHRNLALIGTTDGVPFFDDQKRGAWPFVFRCANLPTTLSQHMANCHLSLLSANEFWEVDTDAHVLRRTVRGPKSLMPHLHIIVDDLLRAYTKGTTH